MPSGVYRVTGAAPDALERFSCAAGPAGWRLTSTRCLVDGSDVIATHDLVLDDRGRQLRVEVTAGAVVLRGGLTDSGLEWSRDGVGHRDAEAVGFTGSSAAFLVATARLLSLAVGARRRVALVALADHTLAATRVEQGWSLVSIEEHATDLGPLPVSAYDIADLSTGTVSRVHLAGDVVVAAPGIELLELTGPPTR